jgi:hypothetical protein
MATVVDLEVDGVTTSVPRGKYRVGRLKGLIGVAADRHVALIDGAVERCLADDEEIAIPNPATISTVDPLVYRPSPKHKREPSRGFKGTICQRGVPAQDLLVRSYVDAAVPGKRWAWAEGCAYCAHYDNAGGWHGWPVRLSEVPPAIWRRWLSEQIITSRDLRRNVLCADER